MCQVAIGTGDIIVEGLEICPDLIQRILFEGAMYYFHHSSPKTSTCRAAFLGFAYTREVRQWHSWQPLWSFLKTWFWGMYATTTLTWLLSWRRRSLSSATDTDSRFLVSISFPANCNCKPCILLCSVPDLPRKVLKCYLFTATVTLYIYIYIHGKDAFKLTPRHAVEIKCEACPVSRNIEWFTPYFNLCPYAITHSYSTLPPRKVGDLMFES